MAPKKVSKREVWKLMAATGILQIHAEAVLRGKYSLEEAQRRTRSSSLAPSLCFDATGTDGR